jgi:hypothetical protein
LSTRRSVFWRLYPPTGISYVHNMRYPSNRYFAVIKCNSRRRYSP